MNFKNLIFIIGIIFLTNSCGFLFREIVTPNMCMKCEILNPSNVVVWSSDECGGEVYNMETKAKASAYDYGCDFTLNCKNYRKKD